MNHHPSAIRSMLLAPLALGCLALGACVAEVPARPGVDYGYVAGGYSTAPTPYAAAPYDDPYDDYYGYGYGYGSAYYGNGYYYGPSTTFVYTRDHYYPAYGYRSHSNSWREGYRDRDDHDDHHGSGGYHGNDNGHSGNYRDDRDRSSGGNWNHERPGRPDLHAANPPQPHDRTPRPVMGGDRPSRNTPQPHDNSGGTHAERLLERLQGRDSRKRD